MVNLTEHSKTWNHLSIPRKADIIETNIEVAEAQIKNKDNNDNPNTNQKETFLSNLKNISEPITDIKLKLESSIMKNKTLELAYTEMKGKYDKLETNLNRKQDMLKKVADRYKEIQKRFKDTKTKLKKIHLLKK